MTDSTPRLSVCVIAKNEAANLPRCLASVAGLAEEVLVTDTGSTDDTVALAEGAGASVDFFEWVDDFSAAYTHCVGRATGDWVLLLDADEELLPESRDELRDCLRREDAFAYTVLRQDLRHADRLDVYTEMLQTRLWRPRAGMAFVGRIHHQFTPPLEEFAAAEGRRVLGSTIRLRHYGYVGSDERPKLERAERLMALELEDRPDQFYFLVELGRTRVALGDASGVELLGRACEQAAADDPQVRRFPGQLACLLEHVLAADVLPEGFPMSLGEAERLAAERFPRSAPILWQRALARFKSGRFDECIGLLEQLLELGRSGDYEKYASFEPDILGCDAVLNLGVCYTRIGRVKDALRCFEQLVDDPKHGASARTNSVALRKLVGRRT